MGQGKPTAVETSERNGMECTTSPSPRPGLLLSRLPALPVPRAVSCADLSNPFNFSKDKE